MKTLVTLALASFALSAAAAQTPTAVAPAANPGTALITGSDRGIGLALTREFTARGWRVIATCRDPSKAAELAALAHDHSSITIEKLDVSDNAAIDALAARLKDRPIDALINNAGLFGNMEGLSAAGLEPDEFARVMRVNSYAPLRVSAAFLDLVAASRQRKIVGISSLVGSLASVETVMSSGYPNAYSYAMSKAALNMGMRVFAFEAARRQVTTVLISPGAVDTDMQRSLRDYLVKTGKPMATPPLAPEASAHAMVLTIEQLQPGQNGKFLSREGAEIPW